MWFEDLMGFVEEAPSQVRRQLVLEASGPDGPASLTSRANGKTHGCGWLETPSVGDIRAEVAMVARSQGIVLGAGQRPLSLREVIGDAGLLHAEAANAGATFQVASQFNLLEMASTAATPADGVGIYEYDHTQGPACAIAAGAGTVFRNYYAGGDSQQPGQDHVQIDCLDGLTASLCDAGLAPEHRPEMVNGYAMFSDASLCAINRILSQPPGASPAADRSAGSVPSPRDFLRVGVHRDVEVTLFGAGHQVTQVYCSALPVAYNKAPAGDFAPLASIVLEGAYEATLGTAFLSAVAGGSPLLYLTLLGGGVFGNDEGWILAAIERALAMFAGADLEVFIVSYGSPNPALQRLVNRHH